jgi:hypothetical protein
VVGAPRPAAVMVTLTAAAPAGGASVSLSSSIPAVASVPPSVTVPARATSATFSVTTAQVTATTSVTISAGLGGVTRTASLSVVPADTVKITLAEYDLARQVLKVQATSTSTTAALTVSVTSMAQVIGTLTNVGGGKSEGQFAWPVEPQSVTVKSSGGGSATRTVTAR